MSSGNGKSKRRRVLLWSLSALVLLLVAIYTSVSVYATDRLYHPVRWKIRSTPAQYGMPYETVHFTSTVDNIPLVGWYMGKPGAKTILVLHGNSSARDNYIGMELSTILVAHGYAVFTFDFRAHGESGGQICSDGEYETRDVAGALAYLRTRGVTEVGVIGHSMGAATALLSAPDHPEMRAIVADSSFADLFPIIDRQALRTTFLSPLFYPGVVLASKLLYNIDVSNIRPEDAVRRIGDRPVLLIHATGDDLIPVSNAYELQKAGKSGPNLQLWVAKGAGHVSAFADNRAEYAKRLLAFFDKFFPAK